MEKLMTLTEWAAAVYGDHPPSLSTLRLWARESRIYPAPERHGRTYYVPASARYIDPTKPITTARPVSQPKRGSLVERLRQETQRGKTA